MRRGGGQTSAEYLVATTTIIMHDGDWARVFGAFRSRERIGAVHYDRVVVCNCFRYGVRLGQVITGDEKRLEGDFFAYRFKAQLSQKTDWLSIGNGGQLATARDVPGMSLGA